MNNIIYRPIEQKDYSAVRELISQSFDLPGYVSNPSTLLAFKNQYLYSCLAEASYTCVAVKNNTVIGVIMGNAKSQYHFCCHIIPTVKMMWYSSKMYRLAKKHDANMDDFKNLHKIYYQFNQKHKGEFNGVLTLFAVSEASRGLGVGKHLWNCLQEYLSQHQVNRIYLYTDSTCNTGFYDSQEFKCVEKQPLTVTKKEKKHEMEVYLYTYSL